MNTKKIICPSLIICVSFFISLSLYHNYFHMAALSVFNCKTKANLKVVGHYLHFKAPRIISFSTGYFFGTNRSSVKRKHHGTYINMNTIFPYSPWFLYWMVAHFALRTYDIHKVFLRKKNRI